MPLHAPVKWVDHAPNTRFAVYNAGTIDDKTDDFVLDNEAGLVSFALENQL